MMKECYCKGRNKCGLPLITLTLTLNLNLTTAGNTPGFSFLPTTAVHGSVPIKYIFTFHTMAATQTREVRVNFFSNTSKAPGYLFELVFLISHPIIILKAEVDAMLVFFALATQSANIELFITTRVFLLTRDL